MKNRKYDCNVIVCGPAVGKTYLAAHDKRFIDLDGIKSTYKYGLDNVSNKLKENGKLNRGVVVNEDSTEYAIKILKKEIIKNNILLISPGNKSLMKYIIENKIDYCLVYANINFKEEYKQRMIKRGNNKKFIDEMTENEAWNKYYKENVNDMRPKYKIELKNGEYLSDIKNYFLER